jgi:hypothetical protein
MAGPIKEDRTNVIRFVSRRLQERIRKLHPDRRESLEWLKKSYPDRPEEELLKEMEDYGF